MKILSKSSLLSALGAVALVAPHASGGTFTSDFSSAVLPEGTFLNSSPDPVPPASGVIEDGFLKLTKNVNGQAGSFVISDLDAGNPVYGFRLTAKVRIGGGTGTPADGMGITFSPLFGTTQRPGHDGIGSGITFTFDQYDNANENPAAPSIDLRVNNTVIATKKVTFNEIRTATTTNIVWANLDIWVKPDGAISMAYKDQVIFTNVYTSLYQPITGGLFGLHANTGGLNENYWVDDLNITTFTTPEVGVGNPPKSQTVLAGSTLSFEPYVNNPDGVTFQWQKNGANIAGATDVAYSTPVTLADNGAVYRLITTGPNNSVTNEATIRVIDIPLPATPNALFNFDDGQVPAGTSISQNAHMPDGVVEPLGTLHLTDALNDQNGTFVIEDLVETTNVHGITASFKVINNSPGTPADGFSFSFGPGINGTDRPAQEDGVGSGLRVGFDTYDNGSFEAPSVDVRWGGTVIAQVKPLISFLTTPVDAPANVVIRLENDGTLDVAYKGVVLFENLSIPNMTSFTGARVAFGSRTGGASANVWLDDVAITLDTIPGDVRFVTLPAPQMVLAGQTANFWTVVNDTNNVTFQWFRGGVAITDATNSTYSLATIAGDNGAMFHVTATKGATTITSAPVKLTIADIAPTLTYDFNSGTPAGTVVTGTTPAGLPPTSGYISATGGVGDSGVVHLVDALNGQSGAFVVQSLQGGAELAALNVAFDVRMGGGSANSADGWNFNFNPGLPETSGTGVDGTGNGLRIVVDIYDNAGGEAPAIEVWWRNAMVAQQKLAKADVKTDVDGVPTFKTFYIKLTADGKVDVSFGGRVIFDDVQLPNYATTTAGKIGFYAVTGGLNENIWIDNLRIEAIKAIAPLRIVTEPADVLVMSGQTATFTVGVSDPEGVTFQWFRNGQPIASATGVSYTTPALAITDNGAQYSVTATRAGVPLNSRQAVATVVAPIVIGTPTVSYNFDDGAVPENTVTHGRVDDPVLFYPGGFITTDGGVNNSGVLHLTDNINGQAGSFYVRNLNGEDSVGAFTAAFKLRIGGGSSVPADGVSFNWSTGVSPDNLGENLGEDGNSTGLTIAFDIYDNGQAEAPAIDIIYKGQVIASRKVPIASLNTDTFADVVVRLESDGTVDVQHNGNAIHNNVLLPGFAPQTGAHFALSGRTGGLNANQWIDDVKILTVGGPTITIAKGTVAGTVELNWTGGSLQSAPAITGPWSTLDTETSPSVQTTSGDMRFFRVIRPL